VAGLRKLRHRGLPKVDWQFTLAMAACDLVRLPKLLAEPVSWPGISSAATVVTGCAARPAAQIIAIHRARCQIVATRVHNSFNPPSFSCLLGVRI